MSKYSDCSFLNMIDYSEGRLFKSFHSAILQYPGKKYGVDFWVIILSVRYLQYFIWYLGFIHILRNLGEGGGDGVLLFFIA